MNLSSSSSAAIKTSIEKVLGRYLDDGTQTTITDIYLQPKLETGELVLWNDDDEILGRVPVKEWQQVKGDIYALVEPELRNILAAVQKSGKLEHLSLLKPYSFVLVDEEKETITELLLVDDSETMFLSEELLQGLDDELNAFLKELLEK